MAYHRLTFKEFAKSKPLNLSKSLQKPLIFADFWSGRREISRGTILSRSADRLSAVSQACGDGLYGGWGLVSEVEGMVHG